MKRLLTLCLCLPLLAQAASYSSKRETNVLAGDDEILFSNTNRPVGSRMAKAKLTNILDSLIALPNWPAGGGGGSLALKSNNVTVASAATSIESTNPGEHIDLRWSVSGGVARFWGVLNPTATNGMDSRITSLEGQTNALGGRVSALEAGSGGVTLAVATNVAAYFGSNFVVILNGANTQVSKTSTNGTNFYTISAPNALTDATAFISVNQSNAFALASMTNLWLTLAQYATDTNAITAKLSSNVWAQAWGALTTNALTAKLDSNLWAQVWGALATNALTGKLASNSFWGNLLGTGAITNLASAGNTNTTQLSLVKSGTNNTGLIKTLTVTGSATASEQGDTNIVINVTGGGGGGTFTNNHFVVTMDGGGGPIPTGVQTYIPVPTGCTITGWDIVAADGNTGSIVVDVWKDTYANYPPTVADTIAGSEKPTISSSVKGQDTSLSTWTTACSLGDWIGVNVDSVTTLTKAVLRIRYTVP